MSVEAGSLTSTVEGTDNRKDASGNYFAKISAVLHTYFLSTSVRTVWRGGMGEISNKNHSHLKMLSSLDISDNLRQQ